MSGFALETNRSLENTLEMRFGELVAEVTRVTFFIKFFFLVSFPPIHLPFFGLFRLLKLSAWIRLLHYALTKNETKRFRKNFRKRKEIGNSPLYGLFVRAFLRF